MTLKQKRMILRLSASLLLFLAAIAAHIAFPALAFYFHIAFFLPSYLVAGAEVVWRALGGVFRLRLFDETFLMTVATIGAFAIGEYPEAVFVMLFYRVGELFEGMATRRARGSLSALASLVPDTARLLGEDGSMTETDAEDVPVGAFIRVLAGDRVPLDAVVEEGSAALDLSSLTGESLPKDVLRGDVLPAGAIVLNGALTLKTLRASEESTAARILEMVENATDRKAQSERFITRFARVYTPIVCLLAVAAALILPLFGVKVSESVYIALSFLVISCPCALVISVPLAFFAGVGGAARHGILFKGSGELERLAAVGAAAFDKTGTLTRGVFRPTAFLPAPSVSEETLFTLCAAAESGSAHPIARSVTAAYRARYGEKALPAVYEVEEHAGGGICARVAQSRVLVGKRGFLSSYGVSAPEIAHDGGILYVASDGVYLGAILIRDTEREDSGAVLASLRGLGFSPLLLLSGDRQETALRVGEKLGLDGIYGELLPEDKAQILAKERKTTGKKFLYIGDGINDAPALAEADVGMAMGALGTDAAESFADVILLRDGLADAAVAVKCAKKTVRIVKENVIFILTVKAAVMLLSLFSLVGMWAAVFADVGVSVVSILNAIRR